MKITAEIKDGKFIYEYEVGSSSSKGTMEMNADLLVRFTSVLQLVTSHSDWSEK